MTTLKEALAIALEKKNKQVHRIDPRTKRGRQHIASTKDQQDCHHTGGNDINATRDSRSTIKGTIGKRDI